MIKLVIKYLPVHKNMMINLAVFTHNCVAIVVYDSNYTEIKPECMSCIARK